MSAPWASFLLAATRKYPWATASVMIAGAGALAAIAAALWFVAPIGAAAVVLYSPLALWGIATLILASTLTRPAVVIRPDAHRVCFDEQRWWRDDEIAIPDAVKREYKRRRVAFLYHVYEPDTDGGAPRFVGLAPFEPWAEPLKVDDESASAGLVGGIKATMRIAAKRANHRTPDPKEAIRYGLLAALIVIGLVCAYLAAGMVVEGG